MQLPVRSSIEKSLSGAKKSPYLRQYLSSEMGGMDDVAAEDEDEEDEDEEDEDEKNDDEEDEDEEDDEENEL